MTDQSKSLVEQNPNAFMGLSSAGVAAFIVYEIQARGGIALNEAEAGFIVAGVASAALFLGRKRSK